MGKDLSEQIQSSKERTEILCSSKDCCPAMKKRLLKDPRAKLVFYPKTKNEVRKILMNHKCVIRGGATSYLGQVIPDKGEIILDMSRFDSVQILNNKAVVGGGAPFINIIRMASYQGKELNVFPLSYISATPAGFLSCGGRAGIGSPENGLFHENIEELEVVTPNSEIIKLKGNDIEDLSGSEGILGAITSIKLKIQDKKIRHMHMYGFDSREDIQRFFEESKGIRLAVFFNSIVAEELNRRWDIKSLPRYSMLVQDTNDKDDYKREYREDLASRGVSFIYPRWVCELESSRMNMLDFLAKGSRKNLHAADSLGSIENSLLALRSLEKHGLPVIGTLGKGEILLRVYSDCKDSFDRQKFLMIMDKIFRYTSPASKGRFFESYIRGKPGWNRINASRTKYNITRNLERRTSLNNNLILKKILSPALISMGGKIW